MKKALLLALLLGGCAQIEEIRQTGLRMQNGPPPDDDAECQSYGAIPGTPAYISCRTQFASQRSAEDAQRRAVVGAYLLNRH